ncbi:MAG: bifunctional 3-(3-hydroxy-phenyl)propionate/3-hydroxycinnamic acid hydroxylase [Acidimicrobiales bacterium]
MHEVAVIGLGPTGAVLANLLGQLGVDTVAIERESEPVAEPRAAHFDGEIMRVFQTIGLQREIEAQARPGLEGMHFVSASGQTLMVRTASQEPGIHGHYNSWYFHQPELERSLRRGLERHRSVTQVLGEAVAIDQSDDGVAIEVSKGGDERRIEARYLVGCEGGRSLTRRTMGTSSTDLGQHQDWLCVDVKLRREVDLPNHTVQFCDPARPMTMVNMASGRRRWEIMLMPGDDPGRMTDPETVWSFLGRWLDPDDAVIERSAIYTFHSLIADRWRDGRLFLAGDAAHQTPPFLGQGMCAGIRDAANLAWKLAATLDDGDTDRLDTYQGERRSHVEEFIGLAVRVGDVIQLTDPTAAAERDESFARTGPELFAFPQPAIGDAAEPPIGLPAPQFQLAGGELSDELVGQRWSVLSDGSAGHPDAAVALRADEVAGVAEWLAENGLRWALVRPDRYVASIGRVS